MPVRDGSLHGGAAPKARFIMLISILALASQREWMADSIMDEHTILMLILTARGQALSRQAEALIWMWDEAAGKETGEAHAGSAADRGLPCPVRVHMSIP